MVRLIFLFPQLFHHVSGDEMKKQLRQSGLDLSIRMIFPFLVFYLAVLIFLLDIAIFSDFFLMMNLFFDPF